MPHSTPCDNEIAARDRLVQEFPGVPTRIIDSVLSAYRRVTASLPVATQLAHDRLEDARAT
jgi:hypothetical protein